MPDLHDFFTVGQIVRVQIMSVPEEGKMAKKKSAKIELTMNPQKINRSLKAADLEPGIVWKNQTKSDPFPSLCLTHVCCAKNTFTDCRGVCPERF